MNGNGITLACAIAASHILFGLVGCQSEERPKSPADQATQMVRTRCGPDLDERALAPVLDGSALREVKPLYGSVEGSKGGPQPELRGAVVDVQAVPGVTAEWLDRALECHSAQRVLGQNQAASPADDPFWLPGSVVDIDVQSDRDGFRVAVAGTTPSEGQRILDRAKSFVNAKAGAPPK